jgi:(5-formylfuran-3-yl)methyl phosphate synthase
MTKLLISVRNAAEAQLAIDAGADLIDVKEPRRGSLGAVDPNTLEAIVRQVRDQRPLSVALGELLDLVPLPSSMAHRLRFAKIGLGGCAQLDDWADRWRRSLQQLPPGVAPVAVVYADWRSASSPMPDCVLAQAERLGCRALLVDTFDKSSGCLTCHFDMPQLARLVASVQELGMLCVLAGSLDARAIRGVLSMTPDYIAVRGAACIDGRTSRLDASRIEQLAQLVHGGVPSRPCADMA